MGRLVIFSGAGLSAESGVPTFRGADGLWNGHRISEVCDITTWKANFDLVHAFYNARRVDLGGVEPNAAHRQIAEWARRYDTTILTQNIDDLLERAGCPSDQVVHLHGFLREMECTACGETWDVGYEAWGPGERCRGGRRRCDSVRGVKPAVVFFGQGAPRYAALHRTLRELKPEDVVLVVGTSGQVIAIHEGLRGRACLKILNNLEPIPGAEGIFDVELLQPATQAMGEIDVILRTKLGKGPTT